ncbi:acetylornithine deacetylase/succinyl-diaminopimelate desuccinylase-like protein [Lewinella marina]|uniref:Acetylornithine deacetylase n=1 Tax=Neolewinella marina TaxID=438751 RepID=A0A2G0CGF7_9BACT|nr:M20/M25/M40 family metallo-hydrolase [Neolewinella marina]NJB86476.1 acetylornithine deacetylase/succinyl-diaminopimelate desuccinylase-like protein [Neolewinella marina]PHK99064.1 acetylornithine deacetylase [Neolewinella marina]
MRAATTIRYLFPLLLLSSGYFHAQPPAIRHLGQPLDLPSVLSEYIKYPSVSGSEKAAGDFLRTLCAENGLHITPMGEADGNYNFAASIRPLEAGLPNIIFLNHIDVVPAEDPSTWEHPPYAGTVTETEVWGRGAFDNKGVAMIQLSTVLEAQASYRGQPIPYNVTLLAVSCEENQCAGGARYVVENYLQLLNPAVVIGEGPPAVTEVLRRFPEREIFGISVAHKNALWLKLEVSVETTGHGSITPLKYANREMVTALNRLLRKRQRGIYTDLNVSLLRQLGRMEKGVTGFVMKHPRMFRPLLMAQLRKQPEIFALFSNTITLTGLDSRNEVVNILAPTATALLDCRLLPMTSPEKFLARLERRMNNPDIRITVLKQMPETLPSSPRSPFFQYLSASIREHYLDSEVASIFLPSSSDLGLFRSHGVPAFASVPVRLDRSYLDRVHNRDEHIPHAILHEGPKVYTTFLQKCMGEINVGSTN